MQIQGIYITNPKHPLYRVIACLHVHFHTNAGFEVKYCGKWHTVKPADCYAIEG